MVRRIFYIQYITHVLNVKKKKVLLIINIEKFYLYKHVNLLNMISIDPAIYCFTHLEVIPLHGALPEGVG